MPGILSFHGDTPHYHPDNAVALGRCAQLAYESPASAKAHASAWGFDRFEFLERGDTQSFVMGNSTAIIIAFRGTEPGNLRDWSVDVDARMKEGPFGRVHEGFQNGLDRVWDTMSRVVSRFQDAAQSIWLTGHSLGAALATLAATRLCAMPADRRVYGLCTFGSPRVGNRAFEVEFNRAMRARALRFVNNNDLVTRVPPRVAGFSHVGALLYFDAAGVVRTDPGLWIRFLEGVKGGADDLGKLGPDAIRDHSMGKGYLPLLVKNQQVNPFA